MMKTSLAVLAAAAGIVFSTPPARAEIKGEAVAYKVAGRDYEGYFAANTRVENAPLVLLVHDWDGLDDYERRRAEMLAERGFSAFAVDLYGKGVRPTTTDEAKTESGKLYKDRDAMRVRLFAGLDEAKAMAKAATKTAIIGYCFGGSAVLEFARAGAPLDGFVSFHGGLQVPEGEDFKSVKAPVLVLQGSEDPVSPIGLVAEVAQAMSRDGVAYDMQIYGGARHAFTVWDGGDYDAKADRLSWDAMLAFFDERLR
ncbi:MAG: dienelactone hydrolase family protein [Geminicoccaceae bacterium]|nr:dienelactone hydrolase family protein [Geminicoccaceae bacterium]